MAVNPKFPFPQADRIGKVAVVVDAIGAGASTAAEIAEALGMVDRQGAYYVSAAGYLGLLERHVARPATYTLTDAGKAMLAADTDERAALIMAAVADVPQVGMFLENATAGVRAYYQDLGMDPATAARRASTISSWAETVTNPNLGTQVADQVASVTAAAAAIRQRVQARRDSLCVAAA